MRRFLATLATLAAAAAAVSVNGATANVALNGTAFSNGTLFGNGRISSVHDGNKTSVIHGDTGLEPGFAYTLDLGRNHEITELRIYPRQDGCCPERLTNFRVSIHTAMQTGEIGPEVWGIDQFTDGTNPGSTAGVVVTISPPGPQIGQWIQIRSLAEPVPDYALQMSEVEVIANVGAEDVNRALGVPALSNRPLWGGSSITRLVDGDRSFPIHGDQTIEPGFAYEVNLGVTVDINRIEIIARQDGCCPERLSNYRVSIHTENNGQIGEAVWSATLHTDFSDPGSMPGSKDVITKDLDPAGQFKGVWVRLTSLDDPVPSYALQMTEVEVYGTPEGGTRLLITQQPGSVGAGLGRAATFTVGATAINGDAAQIGYQWQQDGVNIEGATNASYTTAPVTAADDGGKYRCLVSYPGQASLTSDEATLRINYAFGAAAFSNRPLYVPGNWNIAMLVNGNRRDAFHGDIDIQPGFAYEVNLGIPFKFDTIDIYPRQDGCCPERLTNLRVSVHTNNNDQIGQQVWRVDLYTDGTNPGSAAGTVVHLTADRDPAGVFEGQWIRILSLEDPVQNYALQMTELEAFGRPAVEAATLLISQQPQNTASAPARTAAFAVAARLLNGDPNLIAYQWQKNGTNIPGAAGPVYTTPLLLAADEGAKYRCILTYPGLAPVTSDEAVLSFDYNYARGTQAFSNRPLWLPGGWNIAMLVDGSRSGVFHGHENIAPGFAYEVNMGLEVTIERIDLYPRQDGCCPERLMNFRVSVHKDNNGQIGDQVWMADLFTDGSNPGSTADTVVTLTRDLDPAGQFKGQWIRILSLEDPVQNYALQMTELEVIGRVSDPLILAVRRAGAGIVLTWSDGTLESADNINGGWMPVQGAVSPHSVEAIGTSKFYRLSRGGAP